MLEEFIKEAKAGRGYDFIANNFYRMTKEDLKMVAMEALYVADDDEAVAESLEEWM